MQSIILASLLFALSSTLTAHPLNKRDPAATYYSCNNPNQVAITFDDGPWIYEHDIVTTLNNAGAKGTFFVNGNNYECIYDQDRMSDLLFAYNSGHQIASHTNHHLDLATLSWDQVHDEMWKVELAMQRILGVSPAFMRPPYGSYNDNVRWAAAVRNQSLVLWDFDSGDSVGASPEESQQRYDNTASQHPSNILTLNHETIETTAHQVLPHALSVLSNAGYQFVTVAECLGMNPYKAEGTTYQPGTPDGSWTCD